jgi:hypothetical protein
VDDVNFLNVQSTNHIVNTQFCELLAGASHQRVGGKHQIRLRTQNYWTLQHLMLSKHQAFGQLFVQSTNETAPWSNRSKHEFL